jgi:amidophosphoribosyltransferase
MSDEEIAKHIGAKSISWLPVNELPKIIGVAEKELCTACFTGRYPVEDK